MTLDPQKLLARKTVKKFSNQQLDPELLDLALRVAHRAPTAVNSRPVVIYDISQQKNATWLAHQTSPHTADRVFLFCVQPERGFGNAAQFLAPRLGQPATDPAVTALLDSWMQPNREAYLRQQVYLVAGYFAAVLESGGAAGCFVAAFDRQVARRELHLPADTLPELIFACGYPDPVDPGTLPTHTARSFEEFYLADQER